MGSKEKRNRGVLHPSTFLKGLVFLQLYVYNGGSLVDIVIEVSCSLHKVIARYARKRFIINETRVVCVTIITGVESWGT